MSNFDFLKDFDATLWKLGNRIEKQVNVSPSGVKADATTFLEHILKRFLASIGQKYSPRKSFYSQIDAVYRAEKITYRYKQDIYGAYMLRSHIHDDFDEIESNEYVVAKQLHKKLFIIAKKYYMCKNPHDYDGVPDYRPIELDLSDEEIELIDIPDFNEIIEFKYDYCVICGRPNHSSYSIFCSECNRELDNANNYISIRNYFGSDEQFTKEELIEYGIHEGYVNPLVTSLIRADLLRQKGRFYSFNNVGIDEYLLKINRYISVGELITKFREDKITPAEIQNTNEYKEGRKRNFPFYQFYKIVNEEIINKFENDLIATRDIDRTMEYTTVSRDDVNKWYNVQLNKEKRGEVNESFTLYNELLMEEYLELKRQGDMESDIKKRLNITPEIEKYWAKKYKGFFEELKKVKKDLLLDAINEGKTDEEAMEYAGLTQKEFDDIVKVSDFNKDEFSIKRREEIESRKENFIAYLKDNGLHESCRLAKITVDDFYKLYGQDMESDFYNRTTEILMDKFLSERRKGKTKAEATEAIELDKIYVDRWFKRTIDICDRFRDRHIRVIVDLIYEGFVNERTKREISEIADVSVECINAYLNLGKRGSNRYKKLYDYYESEVIPRQLDRFLSEIRNKPLKKALELSELSGEELDCCIRSVRSGNNKYKDFYDRYYTTKVNIFLDNIAKGKDYSKALRNSMLSEKELDECYELGKNGDERFTEFYEKYYEIKFGVYVDHIINGKSQKDALKKSRLSKDELKDDMDEIILDRQIEIFTQAIKKDYTTKRAAKKANVSLNTVYGWFLKGKDGDERFTEFYEFYYEGYVSPGSMIVQRLLNMDIPLNFILKKKRKLFTREDYDFWNENGYMKEAQERLESEEESEEDKKEKQKMKEEILKGKLI